ncbi:hypothetical protein [Sinorhizobium medicae]|uniref:hypothetical protein n=1 Tax=Sinorhizobium medicae TaxID=110321 RepID=UPI001F48E068|nr:hypothetical protein [Sinorhizobium medicae]
MSDANSDSLRIRGGGIALDLGNTLRSKVNIADESSQRAGLLAERVAERLAQFDVTLSLLAEE